MKSYDLTPLENEQQEHYSEHYDQEYEDSGYGDELTMIDGDLYELPTEDVLEADPLTGEPRVEVIIDTTIHRAFEASKYLQGVLLKMNLSGRIEVTVRHGTVHLEILGAEPGLVIGHRGQNLDALQHLVNRMANKDSENLVPITVDADNYRVRRHQQLERMVKSVSREVLDSGKAIITDPMTPSERRLFHIAANKVRGVRTTSFGSGFFQPIKVFPAHLSGHSYYQDQESNGSGGRNYRGYVEEYGESLNDLEF